MYYIYHIPNYKWKSGKIGKIGCTDDLNYRMKRQHAKTYEILETHSDIFIASDREIELQKQYGYPVDTKPYWKVIQIATKASRIKAGKIGGIIGGKTTGRMNVESGHLDMIQKARKLPILQYYKDGSFIKEWGSIIEAANELNLHQGSITQVCKGKRKTCGGFIFKYKE